MTDKCILLPPTFFEAITRLQAGTRTTFTQTSRAPQMVTILFCLRSLIPDSPLSHSRLHCHQGPPSLGIEITQSSLQDNVFDDCNALAQWIRRVHLHLVWLECQVFTYRSSQGYDRTLSNIRPTSETGGRRRRMASWRARESTKYLFYVPPHSKAITTAVLPDYLMYGRFYLPTGRLDALYSTRLSPTVQAMLAAISDPPSSTRADVHSRTTNVSNVMLSLQHDIGKWCTEYSYSAEDGMWGIRLLHNFGRLGTPAEPCQASSRVKVKRVDEEDSVEGGLKGRVSIGAELYFSAKEKSAGGLYYKRTSCLPFFWPLASSLDWHTIHNSSGCYASICWASIFWLATSFFNLPTPDDCDLSL